MIKMPYMGDKIIILEKRTNELYEKGIFIRYMTKRDRTFIIIANRKGIQMFPTTEYKLKQVKNLDKFEI